MPAEIIGIDLGITNCALAYASGNVVEVFQIPQLVNPGEEREEPLLPSFLFLDDPPIVGVLAQNKGLENAGTQPGSVDRLALDCTDLNGNTQTYSVDLHAKDTFTPQPFNPALANTEYRPALTGDPLSYAQEELIQGGYGPRPVQRHDRVPQWRWNANREQAVLLIPGPTAALQADFLDLPAACAGLAAGQRAE